jgi:hypothetical protein
MPTTFVDQDDVRVCLSQSVSLSLSLLRSDSLSASVSNIYLCLYCQFPSAFQEPEDDTHYCAPQPELSSVGNRAQSQDLFELYKSLNEYGTGTSVIDSFCDVCVCVRVSVSVCVWVCVCVCLCVRAYI